MSNQRNAEKDREILPTLIRNNRSFGTQGHEVAADAFEMAQHYLERAVSAEQRVAELEDTLRRVRRRAVLAEEEVTKLEDTICRLESEDRGE